MLGLVTGCFLGLFAAEGSLPVWLAAVPLTGAVVAWRVARIQLALLLLGCGFFWGVHGQRLGDLRALADELEMGRAGEVSLTGTVTRYDDRAGLAPDAWLRLDEGPWTGARVGLVRMPEPCLPGDRLAVRGDLRLAPTARNPGEWNERAWQRRAGLAGVVEVHAVEHAGGPSWGYFLRRWGWQLREGVREGVVRGLDPESREAVLIQALVLGDRSGAGDDVFGVFQRTGTMHVFAVSGLHVGLVAVLGWLVVRLGRVPRTWGLWLVLALVWTYALVTGLRPPAFRAALMATCILAGFVVRRRPALANSLLASVPVVLLFDSFQWRQPGFQLSYAVVASISLFGSAFLRRLRPWVDGDPFLPRVLLTRRQEASRWAREKSGGLAAVSTAAWLGSLPFMGLYFGVVTPVAIVASMVLVPLVFVLLGLALAALLVGGVSPPLAEVMNRGNACLVAQAYGMAERFAQVPGGQFSPSRQVWGDGCLVVFALAGGGAAAHLDHGGGVLIDAGSRRDFYRVVRPALREGGWSPDSLVVTHPDGGHAGGAVPLVRNGSLKQALLPAAWARSPSYRELLDVAPTGDCRFLQARPGLRGKISDEAWLEVLRAPGAAEDRLADDRGMVVRLHWRGWRILFTGDAGFETEKALLESGADLRAEVWVMGVHQSDFTGTNAFIAAVDPRVILLGDLEPGVFARRARIASGTNAEAGTTVWRTSETGAVSISASRDELRLEPFLPSRDVLSLRADVAP